MGYPTEEATQYIAVYFMMIIMYCDLFTKPLNGPRRAKLVRMILHHVFPEEDGDTGGD